MSASKKRESFTSGIWGWMKFALITGGVVWGVLHLIVLVDGALPPFIPLNAFDSALAVFACIVGLGILVELLNFNTRKADERYERDKANRNNAEKEAAETKRQREQKNRVQSNHLSHLKSIPRRALNSYRDAAGWLAAATQYAQNAEDHFNESAYSPFWENVEHSYVSLSNFRNSMGAVSSFAQNYSETFAELDVTFLESQDLRTELEEFPFEIADSNLEVESLQVEAYIHSVVRQAQKDYSFASIYEQRRTTSAVIEGFGSLSSAIQSMSSSLTSSLQEYSRGISSPAAETNYLLDRAYGSDFRPNSMSYEVRNIGKQLETVVSSLK